MRFQWITVDNTECLYYNKEDNLSFVVKIYPEPYGCTVWHDKLNLISLFKLIPEIITGDTSDIKSLIDIYVSGLVL